MSCGTAADSIGVAGSVRARQMPLQMQMQMQVPDGQIIPVP